MIAAVIAAAEDVGYTRTTVAQIVGRAGVSRKTFYEAFVDCEDCFLAAVDYTLSHATAITTDAFERESGWREGIRAALATLLVWMDSERGLAKLFIVDALCAGDRVLRRRGEVLTEAAKVIDQGRSVTRPAHKPPPLTAEGTVGAVFTVLHTRMVAASQDPLADLLGPLMSLIVLPYLGTQAARVELTKPLLAAQRDAASPRPSRSLNPLDGLNMRLTYRTVRVLEFIAEQPGAGNREIAEGSGIVSHAQISRLMTRLARLGLVANVGEEGQSGTLKAWQLTGRGAEIYQATRLLR
jgi:AcrR family transcriptional regulator